MGKFQDKYNTTSSRLDNWDYRKGKYFVTINTRNRRESFGKIEDGKMKLSTFGEWVNKYWLEIPDHSSNTHLDEYIIMPDHIHGIIVLNPSIVVETLHATSLQTMSLQELSLLSDDDTISQQNKNWPPRNYNDDQSISQFMSEISPKKGFLSAIIRSFKSACTKKFNEIHPGFWMGWQPLYYDHIVRNDAELKKIRQYIRNNPKDWKGY